MQLARNFCISLCICITQYMCVLKENTIGVVFYSNANAAKEFYNFQAVPSQANKIREKTGNMDKDKTVNVKPN